MMKQTTAFSSVSSEGSSCSGDNSYQNDTHSSSSQTSSEIMLNGQDAQKSGEKLSPTEKKLQQIWSVVLERRPELISRNDDFVSLGGDSLSAIRAVAKAREINLHIEVAHFLSRGTLGDMAVAISEHRRVAAQAAETDPEPFALWEDFTDCDTPEQHRRLRPLTIACGVDIHDVEDVYPCTSIQEALLVMTAQRPGKHSEQQLFRIGHEVDVEAFHQALSRFVDALPILRTRIVATESKSLQVVIKHGLRIQRASDLSACLAMDSAMPFGHGTPLHRFSIVQSSNNKGQFFVWSAHHAAYDGWSMLKMLSYLSGILKDSRDIVPTPIPRYFKHLLELEFQIADHTAYWQSQLHDLSSVRFPPLSSKLTQYQPQAHFSSTCRISRPKKRELYPISTLLRAAWAVVVATHNGYAAESTMNVVLSGRDIPVLGIENVLAPTLQTIPVRIRIDWSCTVIALLAAVQDQATEMKPHAHWNLHDVRNAVPSLDPNFDPGHLFIVLPAYEHDLKGIMQDLGLKMQPRDKFVYDDAAMAVECVVDAVKNDIDISILFDDQVISKPSVDALLAQYQHVIQQFEIYNDADRELGSFEKDVCLSDIALLSPFDTDAILRWNSQRTEPSLMCMHEIVRKAAKQHPHALAIDAWDGRYTFAEFDMQALKLASRLVDLGIGPETCVGLCFSKSRYAYVAMLAILYAGGTVVPLGISHPVARIRAIVQDCSMHVAIVDAAQAIRLHDAVPSQLVLDEAMLQSIHNPMSAPCSSVSPQNACWIAFTSGSTGTPKGIVLDHSAYSTSCRAISSRDGFSMSTRILQFSDFTFDAVIEETFAVWYAAGCSCVPSEEQKFNELVTFLQAKQVTFIATTPSMGAFLQMADLPTLRTLTFGGEPIRPADVASWLDKPSLQMMCSYGPTECSVIASQTDPISSEEQAMSIGRPISGRFWIVDPSNADRLCPFGTPGELLIEGPILAREYLNRPEQTAAAFLVNPDFAYDLGLIPVADGAEYVAMRFYRTGDLVRQNHDGTYSHLGRLDSQLKIRGQRIERGEIESRILEFMPSARHACVDLVKLDHVAGDAVLLAIIEITQQTGEMIEPTEAVLLEMKDLKRSLSEVLPSYAVPRHILPVAKLPTTTSDKLDRRAVQQMIKGVSLQRLMLWDGRSAREQTRALTRTEHRMRDLWSKALSIDVDQIGPHDDFRQLGGDSISAMRLVALARRSNVRLRFADILHYPRLQDVAKAIDAAEDNASTASRKDPAAFDLCKAALKSSGESREQFLASLAEVCNVTTDTIEDAYPCTPLQEGLMAMTASRPRAYASQFAFRASPTFDLARFKEAVSLLAKHLPILRTRIVYHANTSWQVVVRQDVEWIEGVADVQPYLDQDHDTPFAYGTLLHRFAMLHSPDAREKTASPDTPRQLHFVWTSHHSAFDGWSLFKMFEILGGLYSGKQTSLSSMTPVPRFIAYVEELRKDDQRVTKYWDQELRGAVLNRFPELPNALHKPKASSSISRSLGPGSHRSKQIPLPIMLRAAWALVVASYTNSDEALIAVTLSGRDAPITDVEEMVAPSITTVPVRIRWSRDQSVIEYLKAVERQSDEMVPYIHTGVQTMRSFPGLGVQYDPGHLFVVQPNPEAAHAHLLDTLALRPLLQDPWQFSGYPLLVMCLVNPETEEVQLEFRYDADVVRPFAAEAMISLFQHIYQQFEDCGAAHLDPNHSQSNSQDLKLGQLSLLNLDDRSLLATKHTDVPRSVSKTIPDLVQKSYTQYRNQTAVCAWDGDLSYAELEDYAIRLASNLATLGAAIGTRIGLCMDKSKWCVVATLAILRAGSVVVPLSVHHPLKYAKTVIETSGLQLILVDQNQSERYRGIAPCLKLDIQYMCTLSSYSNRLAADLISEVAAPGHDAWIIFSSGSTGIPKGIVLQHDALCTALLAVASRWDVSSSLRTLQFAAHNFDATILDYFLTLFVGGCICIPSEEQRIQDLTGYMCSSRANLALLTPTLASLIDPEAVPDLRILVLIGEAAPPAHFDHWLRNKDNFELYNGYGPAECSVLTTCSRALSSGAQNFEIGLPICANLWITDPGDYHRLAPRGAPGELLIEGPGLAREYLGDTNRTIASFVEDLGFVEQLGLPNGRRFYRTGDIVRQIDEEGTLTFIGRRDTQVKIRGQRVDLSAIEHYVLRSRDDVKHVCVDLIKRVESASPVLLGVVEMKESSRADDAEDVVTTNEISDGIRNAIRRAVPGFMVPVRFVVVESMPVNLSGKIDRMAVRNLLQNTTAKAFTRNNVATMQAALSPTAERLRIAWAVVLQMSESDIAADHHFDQLGGDSVKAMQLVAVARNMNLHLGVADVLRNPQLSHLAETAEHYAAMHATTVDDDPKPFELWNEYQTHTDIDERQQLVANIGHICGVEPDMIEDVFPIGPLQEMWWAIPNDKPNDYLGQFAFNVSAKLNMRRLRDSWVKLTHLLPMLRTRIVSTSSAVFLQVVLRTEMHNWSTTTDVHSYMAQDMNRPLSVGGPPIRLAVAQRSTTPETRVTSHFIFTAHRGMYDGWTLAMIFRALSMTYQGHEIKVTPPTNRFIKFLDRGVLRDVASRYWRQQLLGARNEEFPPLLDSDHEPHALYWIERTIQLQRSHQPEVSIPMVLRAAWAMTIGTFIRAAEANLAVVLSGREAAVLDIEEMISPTATIVPVRVQWHENERVLDFLRQVDAQSREMQEYAHAGVRGVRRLVPDVASKSDPRNLFVIHPSMDQFGSNEGLRSIGLEPEHSRDEDDYGSFALVLSCTLGVDEASPLVRLLYDDKMMSIQQTEAVMALFTDLVRQMLSVACGEWDSRIHPSRVIMEDLDTSAGGDTSWATAR